MKKIIVSLILLASVLTIFAQTPGRRVNRYGFEVYYRPPVYYDFYITYQGNQSSLNFNFVLRTQNDLFQFINKNDEYVASYEISLTIKKADTKEAVFADVWRNSVSVKEFEKTNSKTEYQVDFKKFSMNLDPGMYRLFLEIMDSGTGKGYTNSRNFSVHPDQKYTDVKLFSTDNDLAGEIILGPEPPIIEFNINQNAVFEFKTPVRDSVVITSKLLQVKEEKSPIIRQKIYRKYADSDRLEFRESISQKYLKEGRYLLKYRIKYNQEVLNLEKYFNVVWFEKPDYLYKYDLALRPMIYILTPEEWEEADNLSYDELGEWMDQYWGSQDPTPETQLNEIQIEFFNRVDKANRGYSQRFSEGWETDRGKALILYGTPDRKDTNRYALNSKPYEIWYYNKLRKKLTFVDRYKEEDYKLISVEEFEESANE